MHRAAEGPAARAPQADGRCERRVGAPPRPALCRRFTAGLGWVFILVLNIFFFLRGAAARAGCKRIPNFPGSWGSLRELPAGPPPPAPLPGESRPRPGSPVTVPAGAAEPINETLLSGLYGGQKVPTGFRESLFRRLLFNLFPWNVAGGDPACSGLTAPVLPRLPGRHWQLPPAWPSRRPVPICPCAPRL